ncbi:2-hydroxyacid dehydrogenase [Nocardia sp. NPDC127579]|uniref:2-hydroxyacid dehydrogenase n=1 Tax=Nocardia sp. NPDC127579 TaxID=3345402 RepID=UPI00362A5034
MSSHRIVVTGSTFPSEVVGRLQAAGLVVEMIPGDLDEDWVVRALDGAWGYVLGGSERISRAAWARVPELRIVAFLGTGYQSFLELPEPSGDLRFTYTPHANSEAVAEFTVALMLDLVRQVTSRVTLVADGKWTEGTTSSLIGGRLGICGTGHIGRAIARMAAAAFGMQIYYWNRTPRPELAALGYRRCDSVLELCRAVNVLSINCAYVPGVNDNLIGAAELAALGPEAFLVNTARAELVEPDALRVALESNVIAAAAIDGYYIEPTPQPETDPYGLIRMIPDRLLVAPHSAYLSAHAAHRMAEMACESMLALHAGLAVPHAIPID